MRPRAPFGCFRLPLHPISIAQCSPLQTYKTSDQHKKAFNSRVSCERCYSIYIIINSLLNINTGEVADTNVNVYKAHEIGESTIQNMSRISVYDYNFTRKDMPITMKTKSSVNTGDIVVEVDPQLFFQRLNHFYSTRRNPSSVLLRIMR